MVEEEDDDLSCINHVKIPNYANLPKNYIGTDDYNLLLCHKMKPTKFKSQLLTRPWESTCILKDKTYITIVQSQVSKNFKVQ